MAIWFAHRKWGKFTRSWIISTRPSEPDPGDHSVNIEYHKWWSEALNQEMELKVYGHAGKPAVVFPAQGGRFFEFEDFGMVRSVQELIEAGRLRLFTVDSIDSQTWANWNAHPADRAHRHEDYDRYVVQEVLPFARKLCGDPDQRFISTGCSMGAYHAANFFFRHPDQFDGVIALSGLYQLGMFVGDYMDENVYFNSPIAYLSNLSNQWYIDRYQQSQIIICCGQGAWEEPMLADTLALKKILEDKSIPAWIDIWGMDVNHDWPWWRKMAPFFFDKVT
jgi:esterase/lipase superfamily enzyme